MKLGDGSKVKMHSTPECSERAGFGWKQWSKDWLFTTRSGCFMTTGYVGNEPERTAAHATRSHNP